MIAVRMSKPPRQPTPSTAPNPGAASKPAPARAPAPAPPSPPPPPPEPDSERKPRKRKRKRSSVSERIETLGTRFAGSRAAEILGLLEILGHKRKLFTLNFLAGLARGVGFFLGLTLVGGLLIGIAAMAFDFTAKTLGLKDVSFTSFIRGFAVKAVEAERVWQEVRAEQTEQQESEALSPQDTPPRADAEPPRDAELTDPAR